MAVDVLVVGGGGAAARAAIEAHDEGARVLMLVKGQLGMSGATAYAVADYAGLAVADGTEDPTDSPELHLQDIDAAGLGVCDLRLARILVEESLQVVPDLERWGVEMERTAAGKYLITQACFSSRPRNYKLKGHGRKIAAALAEQVKARGIQVIEEAAAFEILTEDGRARGALALARDGSVLAVGAGAVILATGGAGQLFKYNMNPADITGDGYALGYRAGAELVNMEFLQYGLGTTDPVTLFSFWLWPFKPVLRNGRGETFMHRYLPTGVTLDEAMAVHAGHFPFTNRLASRYLEIGIHKELTAGRGGISADFTNSLAATDLPDATRKLWPNTKEWFASRGHDLARAPVGIACFAHAVNGGLRVDAHGETTVPGLFAVGEAAGGPHGADRLGGVMLTACQVFGKRAGRAAALRAKETGTHGHGSGLAKRESRRLAACRPGRVGSLPLATIQRELQELSLKYLLLVRNGPGLTRYLAGLDELEDKLREAEITGHRDVADALALQNLILTGRIMAHAALTRQETRGGHYREDFPHTKEKAEWVVISRGKEESKPVATTMPVPPA